MTARITITIPGGAKDRLQSIAEARGFATLSEYIRAVLSRDSGLDLDTPPKGHYARTADRDEHGRFSG